MVEGPSPTAPRAGASTSTDEEVGAPSDGPPLVWLVWFFGAIALVVIAWWPALAGMWRRWMADGSYYGHGVLVPFICGWLVWRSRASYRHLALAPSGWGLILLAGAAWLLGVGVVERTRAVQQYGFLLAIAGLLLVFLGPAVLRRSAFPLLYAAAFMVPLPGILLGELTMGLKLLVTSLTFDTIHLLGVPAVLAGDTIHFRGRTAVHVDDVCSGLRSLVALLAMAALVAHLQRSRWKALLIVGASVPVAIVGNAVRVLLLSWLAIRGTPAEPGTWLHDLTGVAVYVVALLLLLGLSSVPGEPDSADASASPAGPPTSRLWPPLPGLSIRVVVVALLAGAAVASHSGVATRLARTHHVTGSVPKVLGDWSGTDLDLDARTTRALRSGDFVLRSFTRPGIAAPVELFVLHSDGTDLHPPDACYTIQGFKEAERGTTTLATSRGALEVNRAIIEADLQRVLVFFWYRIDGRHQAAEIALDLRGRGLLRRLSARENVTATTIRVSTPITGSTLAEAEQRIAAFAAEVVGEALAELP